MVGLYRYPLSQLSSIYTAMVIAALIEGGFAILTLARSAVDRSYLYVASGMFVLAGLSVFVIIRFHLNHLPISSGDEGISTYLLGGRYKSIAWSEIEQIERRRGLDPLSRANRTLYLVRSAAGTIQFDDRLENLRKFLDGLNVYIRRYEIHLLSVDHGPDAVGERLSQVRDAEERGSVHRFGVREDIQCL